VVRVFGVVDFACDLGTGACAAIPKGPAEPDPGSNPSDNKDAAVLEDHSDDPVVEHDALNKVGQRQLQLRRTWNKAEMAVEREAWERDHPGEEWQEHMCGMTDPNIPTISGGNGGASDGKS
jgi:hypothetical protein